MNTCIFEALTLLGGIFLCPDSDRLEVFYFYSSPINKQTQNAFVT